MALLDGHTCCAGPELDAERILRALSAIVVFHYVCSVAYYAADSILTEFSPTYRKMSIGDKGDCAGRVYSSIHALIAPLGHLFIISRDGGMGDFFADNCPAQEMVYGISIGYFLFDSRVLQQSKVERWQVFLIHHVLACYPLVAMLLPGYGIGCFPFGFGMVIEFTNITMNIMWWLEKYKLRESRVYTFICYVNFGSWVIFRIGILYALAISGLPKYYRAFGLSCPCVYPQYVIISFLLLFCTYAFVVVVVPDFVTQVRETKSRREKRNLALIPTRVSLLASSM